MRSLFLFILGLSTWSISTTVQAQSAQSCLELFTTSSESLSGEPLRLFRGPEMGIYFLSSHSSGAGTLRMVNFQESTGAIVQTNNSAALPSGFVVERIKFSEGRLVLLDAQGQQAVVGYDATNVPRIYNRAMLRNFMDRKIDLDVMEDLEKIMDVAPGDFSESGSKN